jgi:hypothetical protein
METGGNDALRICARNAHHGEQVRPVDERRETFIGVDWRPAQMKSGGHVDRLLRASLGVSRRLLGLAAQRLARVCEPKVASVLFPSFGYRQWLGRPVAKPLVRHLDATVSEGVRGLARHQWITGGRECRDGAGAAVHEGQAGSI